MIFPLVPAVAFVALFSTALSVPAPAPAVTAKPDLVEKRQIGSILSSVVGGVTSALNPLESELAIIESIVSVVVTGIDSRLAYSAVITALEAIEPTATPTAVSDVPSILSSLYAQATPTGYIEQAVVILLGGLNENSLTDLIEGESTGGNNPSNTANPTPKATVYPKKLSCDAPYSQSEATLREQIYIPSTFTYGTKPPVILFPGTGGRGGENFAGNFEVTLADVDYADIVWVNPINFLLGDAQLNGELAAYAINYVSAISGGVNVSIIAWSQGNINVQWATKYWPSTRLILSDHIAISPDYHGTDLANLIDPGNTVPYPPSLLQQEYNSNFIKVLRSNGGDSAYVPTTNIYSGFYDEIVEPQQGTNASAFLLDARNVGVTNAEVQAVCGADTPAAFFQTHESMLANSLSFALAVDALTHAGPGLLSRIDTSTVCQEFVAPGLGLADYLATEEAILVSAVGLLVYPEKVVVEPSVSAYFSTSPTACKVSSTSKTSSTSTKTSSTSTKTSSTSTKSSTSSKKTTSSTMKTSTSTKTAATSSKKAVASSTSTSSKKTSATSTTKKTSATTTKKTSATATTEKAVASSTTKKASSTAKTSTKA